MSYFVRLPTKWIHDKKLGLLTTRDRGVLELKVYFALLILKGRYQRSMKSEEKSFPATLDEISEHAHVSRPHALQGLQRLRKRKLIKVGQKLWRRAGVGHRTTFHTLLGPEKPFFKFPWELIERSDLLRHLRLNNRGSLNALKVYLILATFSNNQSGVSRISHKKMSEYGAHHNVIRAGVDLLISAGLVAVYRYEHREYSNAYVLSGVSRYTKRTASDESGTTASADSDMTASSPAPSSDTGPFDIPF